MSDVFQKNEYINQLVRHIEQNLASDLNAELLSRTGTISRAQLYRDFYNITGHSVKEYIRKRRLSNALTLIRASDIPLADIAYQCGYSSQQALCRAVKRALNMTPLKYKNSEMCYFYPPYNGDPVQSVTVEREAIPKTLCFRFYHSRLQDIEYKAIKTFLKLQPDYQGRIFGRNGKQNGTRFCYELFLTDTERDYTILEAHGFIRSEGIDSFTLTFATAVVKNDDRRISAAWNYLYHTWLQFSMFEYINEPFFEEYIIKSGRAVKLKLYLPIKKREEETKIALIHEPDLYFIISKAKGTNAEKMASKTVIDYLSENYPYIIKTSRELYLHKDNCSCVCGIKINSKLKIKEDANVEIIAPDRGYYLVLMSNVMGDYERYSDLLLSFASDNGISANISKAFAVYDVIDGFNTPKIRMYCPVKLRQNDNTSYMKPVNIDISKTEE